MNSTYHLGRVTPNTVSMRWMSARFMGPRSLTALHSGSAYAAAILSSPETSTTGLVSTVAIEQKHLGCREQPRWSVSIQGRLGSSGTSKHLLQLLQRYGLHHVTGRL